MSTMTESPYVNHVPTLIGGVGKDEVASFYENHFIFKNPTMLLVPISRTVGNAQIVDEMTIEFNHSSRVDWLVPGLEPSNRLVKFPLVVIVGFEDSPTGPKIYKEHVYWDQATVLLQLGALKENESLDISGSEQAEKVLYPQAVTSNSFLKRCSTTTLK